MPDWMEFAQKFRESLQSDVLSSHHHLEDPNCAISHICSNPGALVTNIQSSKKDFNIL
jgi:hypothetical protein